MLSTLLREYVMHGVDIQELMMDRYGLHPTKRSGDELYYHCPLPDGAHRRGDKNPSFMFNKHSRLFNCWADGGGNVIQFVRRMEGLRTNDEALQILRKYVGEVNALEPPQLQEKKVHPACCYDAYIEKCAGVHAYWAQRGYTLETINKWRLGYDNQDQRVVIPILQNGQWIGTTNRTVTDHPVKYKHTDGLDKRAMLFNLDAVRNMNSVIVVEGPTSVIWMDQCGIYNVVSTMGCNPSREQMSMLRHWNDVTVWFDADAPGQKAARELCLNLQNYVKIYTVGGGDPSDLTKEQLHNSLQNRQPFSVL